MPQKGHRQHLGLLHLKHGSLLCQAASLDCREISRPSLENEAVDQDNSPLTMKAE